MQRNVFQRAELARVYPPSPPALQERLDGVIGVLDSLQDHVREYFTATGQPTEVILSSDQDSTDFGKAVDHVRALQPGIDIVAVGGLGGRVDQGLSQLHQLHLFQPGRDYAGGRMYLVSPENLTFLLKPGSHRIWPRTPPGQPALFGRHVGIVPLCGPSVISTNGLEWDVAQWKTRIGGAVSTSNRLLPDTTVIEVDTDTDVLLTLELAAE